MARQSVVPEIREKLEIWLNDREEQYKCQPESNRTPTLPFTNDYKVNVRKVAEAIGLKQTQEKYLYEREELTSLVDLFAEGQGLKTIGARLREPGESELEQRMILTQKAAKANAQAATEGKAREEALVEELREATEKIVLLEEENRRLRSQLDMVYAGHIVRIN